MRSMLLTKLTESSPICIGLPSIFGILLVYLYRIFSLLLRKMIHLSLNSVQMMKMAQIKWKIFGALTL